MAYNSYPWRGFQGPGRTAAVYYQARDPGNKTIFWRGPGQPPPPPFFSKPPGTVPDQLNPIGPVRKTRNAPGPPKTEYRYELLGLQVKLIKSPIHPVCWTISVSTSRGHSVRDSALKLSVARKRAKLIAICLNAQP